MRYFLISIDTLRYDIAWEVGLTGLFDVSHSNHYVSSNWTLPGHAALLTGDVIHHNCHWNWDFPEDDEASTVICAAKENAMQGTTIAELMRLKGLNTIAYVGGGFVSKWFGFDRGFDKWDEHDLLTSEELPEFPDDSFIFLHTWLVHDYFQDAGWDVPHFRTNEFVDAKQYLDAAILNRGKAVYRDRAAQMVIYLKRLLWNYRDDVIILTSDHGEAFLEDDKQIHHGVYTDLRDNWVANVPLCYSNLDIQLPEITFDIDIKKLLLGESLEARCLTGHYSYGTTQYIYKRRLNSWEQKEGGYENLE
jgi:arylsulfatase A-like enzyme